MKPIIVSQLRVESASGPTCYRGENGFSVLIGYGQSEDPAIVGQLQTAYAKGVPVSLRCARLEIEGRITNLHSNPDGMKDAIAISIDDLRFFKLGK